ncbi:hypothetical protein, partial [Mitsuokella jalaludinii]|uniref:hypothetical protein n=1 Tax=Mitsuokella jalaludinii TaxID=187979 RepID=UPI00307A9363
VRKSEQRNLLKIRISLFGLYNKYNVVLHHTFHEAGPLSFFSSGFFSVDMFIVEEMQMAFVSKKLLTFAAG